MRKGDVLWILCLALVALVLVLPRTHAPIVAATQRHPYLTGFAKFALLATLGELLAGRLDRRAWSAPPRLAARVLVWGLLGMAIALVFSIYAQGVAGAMKQGLLPGGEGRLPQAFFISLVMNLTFAPVMMLAHRMSDTWLDQGAALRRGALGAVVAAIDWQGFVSFVLLKTVPFFWIPAHTITFLLPGEYRVLAAALLSIALGGILAFAKSRKG